MSKTTTKATKKVVVHRVHGNNPKNEYILFLKDKGFADVDMSNNVFNPSFSFDLDKATRFTKVEANKWAKVYYGGSGKFLDKLRVCPQF